jgi:chemotaxis protein MotA
MQTLVIGSILSTIILVATFLHSKASLSTFLNPEGLIIVIGGTISITLVTSKKAALFNFFRLVKNLIISKSRSRNLKEVLTECTKSFERGKIPTATGHEFLDKALSWMQAGLRGAELQKLLEDGARIEIERDHASAQVLSNISKYPPALGMVGTVFGIIAIFNGLGTDEGQKAIGVNLAFAMTATLYGLIVSNFIVSPMAELLEQATQQEEMELAMIVEVVKLWSEKQPAFFVQEHIELYHAA